MWDFTLVHYHNLRILKTFPYFRKYYSRAYFGIVSFQERKTEFEQKRSFDSSIPRVQKTHTKTEITVFEEMAQLSQTIFFAFRTRTLKYGCMRQVFEKKVGAIDTSYKKVGRLDRYNRPIHDPKERAFKKFFLQPMCCFHSFDLALYVESNWHYSSASLQ